VRWEVTIPSYRQDLQRDVDLIEEIIRVYGTDKIPESEVVARGINDDDHRIYTVNEAVAHYLTGQNFDEAFLYSLRDPDETQCFFGEESHKVLALDNPLQSDQSHLRVSLLPGLLDVLKLNATRGTGATRFFERGHVYREVKGEMVELVSVSFVIVADQISREWRQREVADFYTAKTISGAILDIAGTAASKLTFKPIEDCKLWQSGQSAEAGDFAKMGFQATCGLLNIATMKDRWDLTTPVMTFRAAVRTLKDKEVNAAFDGIQELIADKTDYQIRK
jgi:phenylalanyl-tRNA synthetase beta chain